MRWQIRQSQSKKRGGSNAPSAGLLSAIAISVYVLLVPPPHPAVLLHPPVPPRHAAFHHASRRNSLQCHRLLRPRGLRRHAASHHAFRHNSLPRHSLPRHRLLRPLHLLHHVSSHHAFHRNSHLLRRNILQYHRLLPLRRPELRLVFPAEPVLYPLQQRCKHSTSRTSQQPAPAAQILVFA